MRSFFLCLLVFAMFLSLMPLSAQNAPRPVPNQVAADEVADVSLAELKTLLADKQVVLLDCNGSDSYAKGHLPGAIDFDANQEKLAELLPADKNSLIVAYCGGPRCLAYKGGVEAVKKLGYENVKHFSSGTSGWKKAGEKLAGKNK